MLRLFVLAFKNPQYLQRLAQRFGFVPVLSDDRETIWLHAVSVGEVQASKPLIAAIQKNHPNLRIIITTGTPTGAETVKQLYGDTILHLYQPYDAPLIIKRFLKSTRPKLLLVMETELWPNLFHYCAESSIPIALINGRLSERSAKRYARVAPLSKQIFQNLTIIAAQTDEDARRMRSLGAMENQLNVTGSIKFDISVDDELNPKVTELKQTLFNERASWIAASTHEGEEAIVLEAHKKLLSVIPDCLLILAPRHPVRAGKVASLVNGLDLSFSSRSEGKISSQSENQDKQVFLLDTLGELLVFYGLADIAFVGGSLIPHGGHNPIEAANFSRPILIGPYDFNFMAISKQLIERGGACRVENATELADKLIELFQDINMSRDMGEKAYQFVEANRGSSQRVLNILRPFLD